MDGRWGAAWRASPAATHRAAVGRVPCMCRSSVTLCHPTTLPPPSRSRGRPTSSRKAPPPRAAKPRVVAAAATRAPRAPGAPTAAHAGCLAAPGTPPAAAASCPASTPRAQHHMTHGGPARRGHARRPVVAVAPHDAAAPRAREHDGAAGETRESEQRQARRTRGRAAPSRCGCGRRPAGACCPRTRRRRSSAPRARRRAPRPPWRGGWRAASGGGGASRGVLCENLAGGRRSPSRTL